VNQLYVALATIGGLILLLGLVSDVIKTRLWVSEPLVALVAGVALGSSGLGLLHVFNWAPQEQILEQASRLTLAFGLMGAALRLPDGYPLRHRRPLAVLLGPLLTAMWLSGSALVWLILRPPVLVALLIGAVLTPTDPVVSSSILTGQLAERAVPGRIRDLLSAASGANDGLGYPFVLLPILLLTRPAGDAWLHWLTYTLLWEVGMAVVAGAALGAIAGLLLRAATSRHATGQTSVLGVTLALSLTVMGIVKVMGSDSILAVFVAGVAFNRFAHGGDEEQQEHVQDVVARFFNLPIFVLLGLAIPWSGWMALGWRGPVLIVAVLLLRRLPWMWALRGLIDPVRGRRDVLFAGWFGPIGISALFYANLGLRETGLTQVWVVGSLVICASVVAFGVTATPFTRIYGRRAEDARPPSPGPEARMLGAERPP